MLSAALKTEINALFLQEKLEVFEVIRDSVMPVTENDFPELSVPQQRELLRRAEQAAANPDLGRFWIEVKQQLEATLISPNRNG